MLPNIFTRQGRKRVKKTIKRTQRSTMFLAVLTALWSMGLLLLPLWTWSGFIPLVASFGGLVSFVGLWIEQEADDEEKFEQIKHLTPRQRWLKFKTVAGWRILMVGILIEIIVAFGMGVMDWRDKVAMNREINEANPHKRPIYAFSAYVYVVVRPLERTEDLNNTNLPIFGWAENAALFPFKQVGEGNGGTAWLELGSASAMANNWGANNASVNSDCVMESIALVDGQKMLRFDMYFGSGPENNTLPLQNRSFQNTTLTPDGFDTINLSLPIRCEVMGGLAHLNIDNGQIDRTFKIPNQQSFANSATSVATNNTFVPVNWSPAVRDLLAKSEEIRLKKTSDLNAFIKTGNELEEDANSDRGRDRTISDNQTKHFEQLLTDYPRMPIKVFVIANDGESLKYATKVRGLLDKAGYGGTNVGIIQITGRIFTGTNITTVEPPPHSLYYMVNGEPGTRIWLPISIPFNSIKPVISSGSTNELGMYAVGVLDCVKWAFSGIGLNGSYMQTSTILTNGEVGILVPQNPK